ncbi:hypothetical protein LSTR_LSTR007949 [Laodelphax striatellus]|uniref:BBSome-interacting protein 1 n=1 Tax=Laodelphax striatellus TaxID=195883 RepID=A0A482XF97_LAOST|nr:hypothetical protein LSTR_LSTR007949 [Laodelphax striatellus]
MANVEGSSDSKVQEYLPTTGLVHNEEIKELIFCKPKLMPLKSVTLEKLEKMQKEADQKLKEQQRLPTGVAVLPTFES